MANGVKELQDSDFASSIASGTVLVDFWAPWCGPCRIQGPILEAVAAEIGEKAVIAKVNVDDNPQSSAQYGVQSIPTLILFKDGKESQHLVGVQQKEALVALLRKSLGLSS